MRGSIAVEPGRIGDEKEYSKEGKSQAEVIIILIIIMAGMAVV